MVAATDSIPLDDLPDADLVLHFRSGNDGALEVLLRRHRDALYRFCCHLVGNPVEAEDICQESLTRAITRFETLRSGAAFRSWLFRIARNLAADSFRQGKRVFPLRDGETMRLPAGEASPYERFEIGEEHRIVVEALSTLVPSHQQVLMLREVEGLSYAEIGRRLRISQSAVETLLFRARRRLRDEYGKRDVPVKGAGFLGGWRVLASQLLSPATGVPLAGKTLLAAATLSCAVVAAPHLLPGTLAGINMPFRPAPQAVAATVRVTTTARHVAARRAVGTPARAPRQESKPAPSRSPRPRIVSAVPMAAHPIDTSHPIDTAHHSGRRRRASEVVRGPLAGPRALGRVTLRRPARVPRSTPSPRLNEPKDDVRNVSRGAAGQQAPARQSAPAASVSPRPSPSRESAGSTRRTRQQAGRVSARRAAPTAVPTTPVSTMVSPPTLAPTAGASGGAGSSSNAHPSTVPPAHTPSAARGAGAPPTPAGASPPAQVKASPVSITAVPVSVSTPQIALPRPTVSPPKVSAPRPTVSPPKVSAPLPTVSPPKISTPLPTVSRSTVSAPLPTVPAARAPATGVSAPHVAVQTPTPRKAAVPTASVVKTLAPVATAAAKTPAPVSTVAAKVPTVGLAGVKP